MAGFLDLALEVLAGLLDLALQGPAGVPQAGLKCLSGLCKSGLDGLIRAFEPSDDGPLELAIAILGLLKVLVEVGCQFNELLIDIRT